MTITNNLKELIDQRIVRIQSGLFNLFIIFGDTRSGKSTLAKKIGHYMSKKLNVPFTVKNNIFFQVEEMGEVCNDPRKENWIFILDEASFDLMAQDRSNRFQLQLIKFYNTAAKYHQTHILILPNLGELKKNFLLSGHVFGFRTHLVRDKKATNPIDEYKKGNAYAFNRFDLLKIFDHYALRHWEEYSYYIGSGKKIEFDGDTSFFDANEDYEYEAKKDAAINTLKEIEVKKKPNEEHKPEKKRIIERYLNNELE